jgi:hypothetical protein
LLLVVLDVEGGQMQQEGVVLELTEPPIAVEAEQRSDLARRMIMIYVLRRGDLANRAEAPSIFEHEIGFFRRDPIAAREVIGTRTTHLLPRGMTPEIVARKAVRGPARSGC